MEANYNLVKKFFNIIKEKRKEWIIKFITSFVMIGFIAILPLIYGQIIDNIADANYDKAYVFIGVMIIVSVLRYSSYYINEIAYSKLYASIFKTYSKQMSRKMFKTPAYAINSMSVGEFINIVDTDVMTVSEFAACLPYRLIKMLELLFVLGYFFYLNIYIGVIAIIITIVNFVIMSKYGNKVEKVKRQEKAQTDKKTNLLAEVSGGIKEIKNLDFIRLIRRKITILVNNCMLFFMKQQKMKAVVDAIVPLIVDTIKLGVFAYSIYLIAKGNMPLGTAIIIYTYFDKLTENSSQLLLLNEGFYNLKVALRRIDNILDNQKYQDVESGHFGRGEHEGRVKFEDIIFDIDDETTLKKINLEIEPNTFTLLMGHSGSGKTLLVELLLKFTKPDQGRILIDGVDITKYNDTVYSNVVASSRKEPYFFNMSIRNNFIMIEDDFNKVLKVCKAIGVHEYIMSLPNKYDTVIQSGGENIAPQQKQLLSIARVLLKNPNIIVFDESTNLLSPEMERKVYSYLETLKTNHTIIMTSPRTVLGDKADKVIVMEKGKIVGEGKHRTLLKENEIYKKLFNHE